MDYQKAFKFRSFSDRISSIKIDVIHQISSDHQYEQPSDGNSYFQESLNKWRELNCSIPFTDFYFAVSSKVNSLPQVLHHKDVIIQVLRDSLDNKDPLAIESLLDLLVQLARDLQGIFYPHFSTFFPVLVSICNMKDAEIVEKSFTCFAYLFKFLWRHMLSDITNVFKMYSELLLDYQKYHIKRFAVESFGFLLRKVKNLDGLCEFIMRSVMKKPEIANGVGMLMFEVCRGIQKRFHSCTGKVLSMFFSKLYSTDELCACQYLYNTLTKMLELMTGHTHKEHAQSVWTPLLDALEGVVLKWQENGNSSSDEKCLEKLLRLVDVFSVWRGRSRMTLTALERTCKILTDVIQTRFHGSLGNSVSEFIVAMFNHHLSLPEAHPLFIELSTIVFQCMEDAENVLKFAHQLYVTSYPYFHEDILPMTLEYCDSLLSSSCSSSLQYQATPTTDSNKQSLTELMIHHVLLFITKLTSTLSLDLEFPMSEDSAPILITLCEGLVQKCVDDNSQWVWPPKTVDMVENTVWEKVWASLRCLQYARPISSSTTTCCIDFFNKFWLFCCESNNGGNKDQLLMILSQCVATLASILDQTQLLNIISIETLLDIVKFSPSHSSLLESVLKCVTVYSQSSSSLLEHRHLDTFINPLQYNLSLYNSEVRLVTLKILNCFPLPSLLPDPDNPTTETECDLLSICLKAEETPPTLETYRTRLIWLSKLKYSKNKMKRLPTSVLNEIPLRFLLGMLYVNFSLLWEPVCDLISSYAQLETKNMFWDIFKEALDKVSEVFLKDVVSSHSDPLSISNCNSLCSLMSSVLISNKEGACRPDHMTYRISLWKCMGQFRALAGSKSRTLVPLVFKFMESEYGLSDETQLSTQDISVCSVEEGMDTHEEDNMEDIRENTVIGLDHHTDTDHTSNGDDNHTPMADATSDHTSIHLDRGEEKRMKIKRSTLHKTLVAMLTLLSKFTNPKSLFRQEDLKSLYMKLLMNRSSEVQGLALKSLLTYKDPYLTPYRENLEKLLDESAFHEQLLYLSSCSEVCVVDDQHKQHLIPILIRILYGRRRCTVSKSKNSSRRNVIMRYLGANGEQEISEYLHILMAPFNNSTLDTDSPDPCHVIPLKVQQSFLYEMSQLLKAVGGELEYQIPSVLTLVFKLAGHCNQLLNSYREQVSPGFIPSLKSIRQHCINLTSEIIDRFPFMLTQCDKPLVEDPLMSSLVWPQLPKLSLECTQHPTPLLKLLATISHHAELHYLFGVSKAFASPGTNSAHPINDGCGQPSTRPVIHFIVECLRSGKASRTVLTMITEIILELTEPPTDGDQERRPIGVEIVTPYVSSLLDHLKELVGSTNNGRGQDGQRIEFDLLSRLTLIQDGEAESDQLIQLLLPYLAGVCSMKDTEKILTSIHNLVPSSTNLTSCYRPLAKLFLYLKPRSCREMLCNIFTRIGQKDDSLLPIVDTLSKVNSWDDHLIDEPDYLKRQEGFSEAKQLLHLRTPTGHLKINLLLPVLYNALYSVLEVDDISIRDVAANFISHLLDTLTIEDQHSFETIVLHTVVPAVIKGFNSKKETAMKECVSILSKLAQFHSVHPKFSDLRHLINPNPELDFFNNIQHIQLHRRTKAYRFLSQVCSNEDQPLSSFTMMNFLLPLANHVVLMPVKEREHNLLLEVVNVVGAIAGRQKWSGYFYILKHFLKLLPKESEIHKNVVRAVVSVLDNFHFKVLEPKDSSSTTPITTPSLTTPTTPLTATPTISTTISQSDEKAEDGANIEDGITDECVSDDVKERLLGERVYTTVMKQILPRLEANLTANSEVPAHKLSKSNDVAVSEKVLVPIAMAMTKLLLHLPESSLHIKLPGLLMKVCNTMKSRLTDVREAGRDTLLKMAQSLGPRFIHYIFTELTAALTRGYQLHVLAFTIHYLLHGMMSKLNPGDLDTSLDTLSKVLLCDIFGGPSEERGVREIVSKTPEAKSCKSILSFGLVARFLSPSLIPKLLKPIKEMFEEHPSSKTASLIEDILKKVAIGIQRNKSFSTELLLLFIHETLTDTGKYTAASAKTNTLNDNDKTTPLRPDDCHLIPSVPTRANPPRLAKQANLAVHLLSQFSLQLLKSALKKGKFTTSPSPDHLFMLDPFVSILCEDILSVSRHAKLLSKALNCLMIMLPLPLPSIKKHMSDICSNLFSILKHFSYSGSVTSSVNQELLTMGFKSMTVILRDFTFSTISNDELKLLVSYIEQDVHDYKRQSTAFPLLKVILGRRFMVDELSELMFKIVELTVQGDTSRVRTNSRNVLLQYLVNYPLGKKVNRYLDFLIANLGYEDQSGRESVIETLGLIFSKFPQNLLNDNMSYFLVPIASQLTNEESSVCRQMLAEATKILFKKVGKEKRREIAVMLKDWLSQDKVIFMRLSIQILGFLIDAEGAEFNRRLSVFMPLISKCLNLVKTSEEERNNDDTSVLEEQGPECGEELNLYPVALKDHLLFNSLITIEKIFTVCGMVCSNARLNPVYDQIWVLIQYCLLYPHSWVRLVSCRLFGLMFASCNIDDMVSWILSTSSSATDGGSVLEGGSQVLKRYFIDGQQCFTKVKDLKQCFMTQLKAQFLSEELANQAIKNQVFIAKLLFKLNLMLPPCDEEDELQTVSKRRKVSSDSEEDKEQGDHLVEGVVSITPGQELRHLIYQMDRLSRYEAGHHPKESMKRSYVFKWLGAVAMAMGKEHINEWLYRLVPPLYKELSNDKKVGGEDLHNLASEIIEIMKKLSGKEVFSLAYSQVHATTQQKRAKRKAQYALEAVVDPEKHILRRWRKGRKKRESKIKSVVSGRDFAVSASKRQKLMRKFNKKFN